MDKYSLPKSIRINDTDYSVRSDFREVYPIMEMLEDDELSQYEKTGLLLSRLYGTIPDNLPKAVEQASLFIDGATEETVSKGDGVNRPRLFSWAKDAKYIISGVDKTLGYSTRSKEYLHWWEFLGGFWNMDECAFSHIVHMRHQKITGKLTKEELKIWNENPALYELKSIPDYQNLLDEINGR